MVKPSISFLGAGRLARALAPGLKQRGYLIDEIVVRNRATTKGNAFALATGVSAKVRTLEKAVFNSAILWFCVPDDAITPLAAKLSVSHSWSGKIVFHSSGALPSSALAILRLKGAAVASVHPMMSFSDESVPLPPGITFGVEGDAKAVNVANQIIKDVQGIRISLKPSNKAFYHLMGTFSSPLVIALLAGAGHLGRAAQLSPANTRNVIGPLVQATIQNYLRNGLVAAYTGPVRRGDIQTIKMHLGALKNDPILLDAYRSLARVAIRELPVRRMKEIESLLRGARKRKSRAGKL